MTDVSFLSISHTVAISSGTLLVTGGSSCIGAWVVKRAVDRGYSVVAAVLFSVRIDTQEGFLFNRFPNTMEKSYVLVPVIEKEGAYNEVVKHVDAIIHAASPVIFRGMNPKITLVIESLPDFHPKAVLRPTIRGALGILESAHKYGKNLKRVVLTSCSTAIGDAIVRDGKPVRDETVWNPRATTEVEARGKGAGPVVVYAAKHKPSWDLVTLLPPYIWGPYIHQPGKPFFGSSPGILLEYVLDRPDTSGACFGSSAEVRDTANIHILALEHPDVGGERALIDTDPFAGKDVYDIFNSAVFQI
ncbi:hypothetical protein BS47DRAFT_1359632 [Hydnum rufescens UP504]|uniref:NAD-dependent epimerase/dehydratase domain-containing protein n=1 Tax=Hydnum rufescens UP504 TaxID=1448309 RepID=A0A9P6B4N9_9AGAM|nr:hypothetical protein BS47DRAFT_1359632 [Hydnum rufescens UP504]